MENEELPPKQPQETTGYTDYFDTNKNRIIPRPDWFYDGGLPVSDDYLRSEGIFPVTASPATDSLTTYHIHGGYQIVDGFAVEHRIAMERSLDDAKNWMKRNVTNRRKTIEQGGITINGAQIDTSLESLTKINGAVAFAQLNPDEAIEFSAENGWVSLDAQTMIAIGQSVAAHVQNCFKRARQLHQAIDAAEDLTALEAITIEDGWPS